MRSPLSPAHDGGRVRQILDVVEEIDVEVDEVRLDSDQGGQGSAAVAEVVEAHGDTDSAQILEQVLDRFALGTRSKHLRYEPDGSLIIYVQKDRPDADKVSNWLPAPADAFSLYIRAYWPLPAIEQGSWTPPPVVPL